MPRNPHQLTVFAHADSLVIEVYKATALLPADERYGLTNQVRRAAVSIPTNIVEGSQRHGLRDYLRFIEFAAGSAAECCYLLGVCARLNYLPASVSAGLIRDYEQVVRSLEKLRQSLAGKVAESATPPSARQRRRG